MYLIGAAATWIPPGVEISINDLDAYTKGLALTYEFVRSHSAYRENPYAGFAVAAFMGSELGRKLSRQGLDSVSVTVDQKAFCKVDSRAVPQLQKPRTWGKE